MPWLLSNGLDEDVQVNCALEDEISDLELWRGPALSARDGERLNGLRVRVWWQRDDPPDELPLILSENAVPTYFEKRVCDELRPLSRIRTAGFRLNSLSWRPDNPVRPSISASWFTRKLPQSWRNSATYLRLQVLHRVFCMAVP